MIFGRQECFCPRDPTALSAIALARKFPQTGASVPQAVIEIAPRNGIGINQHALISAACGLSDPCGDGANHPINRDIKPHIAEQAL